MPVTVLAGILGLFAISRSMANLWVFWTTDPFRSIWMFFPIVTLLFVLREARRMDWLINGTWWGLVVLAISIAGGHVHQTMLLALQIARIMRYFPPDSIVVFGYA